MSAPGFHVVRRKQLLAWCKIRTAGYATLEISNFTTSWKDGLGFSALVHSFKPRALDYERLLSASAAQRLATAFEAAETYLGIKPKLSVASLTEAPRPDDQAILAYVSEFYHAYQYGVKLDRPDRPKVSRSKKDLLQHTESFRSRTKKRGGVEPTAGDLSSYPSRTLVKKKKKKKRVTRRERAASVAAAVAYSRPTTSSAKKTAGEEDEERARRRRKKVSKRERVKLQRSLRRIMQPTANSMRRHNEDVDNSFSMLDTPSEYSVASSVQSARPRTAPRPKKKKKRVKAAPTPSKTPNRRPRKSSRPSSTASSRIPSRDSSVAGRRRRGSARRGRDMQRSSSRHREESPGTLRQNEFDEFQNGTATPSGSRRRSKSSGVALKKARRKQRAGTLKVTRKKRAKSKVKAAQDDTAVAEMSARQRRQQYADAARARAEAQQRKRPATAKPKTKKKKKKTPTKLPGRSERTAVVKKKKKKKTTPTKKAVVATGLRFHDEDLVQSALALLPNTSSDTNWVLFKQRSDGALALSMTGPDTGEEGLKRLCIELLDESVSFCFFGVGASDADANGNSYANGFAGDSSSQPRKIVLIVWLGELASGPQKARSGPLRVELTQYAREFFTVASEMIVCDREDITMRPLLAQLRGKQGSIKDVINGVDDSVTEVEEPSNHDAFGFAAASSTVVGELQGTAEAEAALRKLAEESDNSKVDSVVLQLGGDDLTTISVPDVSDPFGSSYWRLQYLDIGAVSVFVMRVAAQGDGYGARQHKYVFVKWLGNSVAAQEKAVAREVFPSVRELVAKCVPLSADMEASLPSAVSIDSVAAAAGKHAATEAPAASDPKYADFGKQRNPLTFAERSSVEQQVADMVLDRDVLLDDEDEEEDEDTPPAWLMFTYSDEDPTVMELTSQGHEDAIHHDLRGAPGFLEQVPEDATAFIFARVLVVPEHLRDAEAQYAKPTYLVIHWQGKGTSVLERGLSTHHWKEFKGMVEGAIGSVNASLLEGYCHVSDRSDLSAENVCRVFRIKV